jgi:hypothetical protein
MEVGHPLSGQTRNHSPAPPGQQCSHKTPDGGMQIQPKRVYHRLWPVRR